MAKRCTRPSFSFLNFLRREAPFVPTPPSQFPTASPVNMAPSLAAAARNHTTQHTQDRAYTEAIAAATLETARMARGTHAGSPRNVARGKGGRAHAATQATIYTGGKERLTPLRLRHDAHGRPTGRCRVVIACASGWQHFIGGCRGGSSGWRRNGRCCRRGGAGALGCPPAPTGNLDIDAGHELPHFAGRLRVPQKSPRARCAPARGEGAQTGPLRALACRRGGRGVRGEAERKLQVFVCSSTCGPHSQGQPNASSRPPQNNHCKNTTASGHHLSILKNPHPVSTRTLILVVRLSVSPNRPPQKRTAWGTSTAAACGRPCCGLPWQVCVAPLAANSFVYSI
jgi:hypothetical protein